MQRIVRFLFVIGLPVLMIALMSGCKRPSGQESVSVDFNAQSAGFESIVSSISLLPLENDDRHFLGSSVDMYPIDNCFLLVDRNNCKLYLYDDRGHFLKQLGQKGRGPGEFITIGNIQVLNQQVVVFAYPGRIYTYNLDGTLVSMEELSCLGEQSRVTDGGILTYHGHVKKENRLEFYKGDSLICKFLPEEQHVMFYSSGTDVFFQSKNGIIVLDSYSSTIYRYHDEHCSPFLSFNMGKYSIPEEFYRFSDVGSGAMFLLSRSFALVNRYMENETMQCVEIMVRESDEKDDLIYGMREENKPWIWFSLPDALKKTARYLEKNTMVCIVSPEAILEMDDSLRERITNPSILQDIKPGDNYVVANISFEEPYRNFRGH